MAVTSVLAALILCLILPQINSETLDIIEDKKLPPVECELGCARWANLAKDGNDANQTLVNQLWRDTTVQKAAGNACAQPGLSPFSDSSTVGGYAGAYCFCKGNLLPTDPRVGYCRSADGVPEQINLQVSAPDTVVAAFVTFGPLSKNSVPLLELSTSLDMSNNTTFTGVTHTYLSPAVDGTVPQPVRSYNMHFVAMTGLKERTTYYYRVAGEKPKNPSVPNATTCHGWTCSIEGQICPPNVPGASDGGDRCCNGAWRVGMNPCGPSFSDVASFKSLYTSGVTKIAIFGDMGMMSDGNTVHGNILRDAQAGDVDVFVHMGDHAYQMSSDDDRRGDGYMNAYQPLASQVPWLPVIGNHEYYDDAYFHRFLNQSFGVQLGRGGAVKASFCEHQFGCASQEELDERHPTITSKETITADSALGTLLARASIVAGGARMGPRGTVPSNTSRWYSTNIGLVHMIALDMMVYPGATPDEGPGGVYQKAQKVWLEEDLKSVDRSVTPWILAFAHHPLYCSSTTMGANSVEFNERPSHSQEHKQLHASQKVHLPPGKSFKGCLGTGEGFMEGARSDLEPLFLKYGVDMFLAGHEHDYESIWPVKNCSMDSADCYIGTNFSKPQAPVHVVCGEGGTNGADHFAENWGPFTRKQLGSDTPGKCDTLKSGGATQGGCSAGYGRITVYNATHLTYQYVLNVNGTVWDEWTIYQPNHGSFLRQDL
eukprot:m.337443 g.337443  ORF g.337443 m.337443 type:complete len:712 (-) comp18135_c0_seq1:199-2334(-)